MPLGGRAGQVVLAMSARIWQHGAGRKSLIAGCRAAGLALLAASTLEPDRLYGGCDRPAAMRPLAGMVLPPGGRAGSARRPGSGPARAPPAPGSGPAVPGSVRAPRRRREAGAGGRGPVARRGPAARVFAAPRRGGPRARPVAAWGPGG